MTPTMKKQFTGTRCRVGGFTMVELLVAMSVSLLVLGGVVGFFIQGLNTFYYDSGRLMVNRDNRAFASQLAKDGSQARYFVIFPNFLARSKVVSGVTIDDIANDSQSGDFLLFCYTRPLMVGNPAGRGKEMVVKIIGYYRDYTGMDANLAIDQPENGGPIRRFEVNIPDPGIEVSTTVNYQHYQLLQPLAPVSGLDPSTGKPWPVAVNTARGTRVDGRLFYNFRKGSAVISGQFQEAGNLRSRFVTNTYNFSVSPRG